MKEQETVLKMAILIKEKFPEMDDKECGAMAKKLYIMGMEAGIETLRNL